MIEPETVAGIAQQPTGYRLSAQQKQRWDNAGVPGSVTLQCRVSGVDRAVLEQTLPLIIDRHAILRTDFFAPPGLRALQRQRDPGFSAVNWEIQAAADGDACLVGLSASCLVADRETLRLLLQQAVTSCGGSSTGELGYDYLSVSEWQYDQLAQSEARETIDWWRARLETLAPNLLAKNGAFGAARRSLPVTWKDPAGQAVERDQLPLVTLTLWLITQAIFNGETRQSVGCRFDGRFTPELAEVLGPLNRYLPLSVEWSERDTLDRCVQIVRGMQEEASDRQEYYDTDAIEGAESALSRLPAFSFNLLPQTIRVENAEISVLQESEDAVRWCPYGLDLFADGESLRGSFWYIEGTLSETVAASMRDTFASCLTAYFENPRQPVRQLQPLTQGATADLLRRAGWQGPTDGMERSGSILNYIVENSARFPERPAAVRGGSEISYGELCTLAATLARTLRAFGVDAEIPVAVLIQASPEAVVGMMAILLAGGVYVPLSPDDPPARLAEMCHRLNISVALVPFGVRHDVLPHGVRAVDVNLNAPKSLVEVEIPPLSPQQGAYVIHTSGSTGESRPVLVPHETLMASTLARRVYYGEAAERFLMVSPLVFDSSIAGLFWTLMDGGTLLFPQEVPANPEELRRTIEVQHATHILCIPRLLQAIAEGTTMGELSSLRTAIVAGEICSGVIARDFAKQAPSCTLFNEYGASEAGVWSTACRIDRSFENSVPIGTAVPGVKIYVCSDTLNLVPLGAPGEICVGGQLLARGYVGSPGATAARFLPDPYSAIAGARLYATGDRAVAIDGDTLTCLGRTDNQVKIRGQRVEPEQLEAILRVDPAICDTAVVVNRRAASPTLAVFYSVKPGQQITPDQVRAVLASRLPRGLHPATVQQLEELPRTATGKLDRRRLSDRLGFASPGPSSPPQNELERELAKIWAPLLGVAEVGREDDFFALGGDSIIGLQITARARSAGIHITPRQVLTCRTIARLSAQVEQQGPAASRIADGTSGLTPIQKWFFAQNFADPAHYNQAVMTIATEHLDERLLIQALRRVAAAHPALRTRFVRNGQQARGEVLPDAKDVDIEVVDLAAVDPADRAHMVQEAFERAQASHVLEEAPLLRVVVITGSGPQRVMFTAHHLVIDGVSWRVFFEQLAEAYQALQVGGEISFGDEAVTMGHWVGALARRAQDPAIRSSIEYWERQAIESGASMLPVDFPGAQNVEADSVAIDFVIDAEMATRLRRSGEERTVDTALLAALGRALAEWTGRDTTWIALEHHGRNAVGEADPSDSIGWFTVVTPLRLTCRRGLSTAELLAEVGEQVSQMPREPWLLDYVRYCESGPDSERLAALPTPQVSFNNLGRIQSVALPGLPLAMVQENCGTLRSPRNQRSHLIDVTVLQIGSALRVEIAYSRALHAHSTMQRLADRMRGILEDICSPAAALARTAG
ncbi:MAG TPA: amino acid adenylation domain-containing protein [Candidatus Dormibacteraeota bacterium]|nr:amino acid adenylation domain-containing protein [Candidatus Dormibacteraeota bacterium]